MCSLSENAISQKFLQDLEYTETRLKEHIHKIIETILSKGSHEHNRDSTINLFCEAFKQYDHKKVLTAYLSRVLTILRHYFLSGQSPDNSCL